MAFGFASRVRSGAAALLVFAGCAGIDDAIGGHPVDGATLDSGTPTLCTVDGLTPPAIVLTSSAGDQTGDQSSFCSNDDQRGCGVCADSAKLNVKHFTVVHAGDQVTLHMLGGTLVTPGPDQCQPACPPQFTLQSLCSSGSVSREFTQDEAWTVDFAAGIYQLDVGASFSSSELSGSTSDTFGLIVDDARDRGIIDAGAPGTTCGSASSP